MTIQCTTCSLCEKNEREVAIKFAILERAGALFTVIPVCLSCKQEGRHGNVELVPIGEARYMAVRVAIKAEERAWFQDLFENPIRSLFLESFEQDRYSCHYPGCRVSAASADETRTVKMRGAPEEEPKLFGFWLDGRLFPCCYGHGKVASEVAKRQNIFIATKPLALCERPPEKKNDRMKNAAACNMNESVLGNPDTLAHDVPMFDAANIATKQDAIDLLTQTKGPYEDLIEKHMGASADKESCKQMAKACPLHRRRMLALGTFRHQLIEHMKEMGWWMPTTNGKAEKREEKRAIVPLRSTAPRTQNAPMADRKATIADIAARFKQTGGLNDGEATRRAGNFFDKEMKPGESVVDALMRKAVELQLQARRSGLVEDMKPAATASFYLAAAGKSFDDDLYYKVEEILEEERQAAARRAQEEAAKKAAGKKK